MIRSDENSMKCSKNNLFVEYEINDETLSKIVIRNEKKQENNSHSSFSNDVRFRRKCYELSLPRKKFVALKSLRTTTKKKNDSESILIRNSYSILSLRTITYN